MSALSELLTRANKEGLSLQKITDQMRERGHDIGKDTVWKYMTGRHSTVTTAYLRAFVDVFPSLDLAALQRAAELPPELGEWQPPAEAAALTQRERDALEVLIRSMARRKAEEASVTQLRPTAAGSHQGRRPSPAAPEHAEYDVEAAHISPEPAGLPEPESP